MDGLVVGTEKGKLYIFRSIICPLSRIKPLTQPTNQENGNQDSSPIMDTMRLNVCYKQKKCKTRTKERNAAATR